MTQTDFTLQGLWLPLVTPFQDGEVDTASLRRLVRHFAEQPVDGLVLAGTTGEAMTLSVSETVKIVQETRSELAALGREMPVLLGISGSDTRKMSQTLSDISGWPVDGYLVCCPYYTRPSQEGLFGHFSQVADSTDRPIVIYNIPYRTGVNLSNDNLLKLAERKNIVGLKDCSTDPHQAFELLGERPNGFSIMTGEDLSFFNALCLGMDGAILSAAHIHSAEFAQIRQHLLQGELTEARTIWRKLYRLTQMLFSEPSPAAHKYCLWRQGLIGSPEVRLPMTAATPNLAQQIDRILETV